MTKIITAQLLHDINPGISDTLGALVADGVNAWIENLTSRSWGDNVTVTERHSASGVIWLNHMDVTAIVGIKTGYPQHDQTAIGDTSYYWTSDGRLVLDDYGPRYRSRTNYVEVEYAYGVPDNKVPMDLKMAGVGLALAYAEWLMNSGKNVTRAQVGSYTLEFAASQTADPTKGGTVTRDTDVVKSYAMRRV